MGMCNFLKTEHSNKVSITNKMISFDDFSKMGLKSDLLRGIVQCYGYRNPSSIQKKAIVPIIRGKDILAQSQSGTGKTTMIVISCCNIIKSSQRIIQALVLSPTREIAHQI